MKNKHNNLLAWRKIPAAFRHSIFAGVITCLALQAQAAVQIIRFDPPLAINTGDLPPAGLPWNTFSVDFNADSDVDFRLMYAWGSMSAYFNSPTHFGARLGKPDPIIAEPLNSLTPTGSVGAVPLNSLIGSNIVSAVSTNYYAWASGFPNLDGQTEFLGDHEAVVISSYLTPGPIPVPIITLPISNGTAVTNVVFYPPPVSGDTAGKEGVIAVQFPINGQIHYGYIHFDFRNTAGIFTRGVGGVIYGWAYETEPDVSITAVPLSPPVVTTNPPPIQLEPDRGPHRHPAQRGPVRE